MIGTAAFSRIGEYLIRPWALGKQRTYSMIGSAELLGIDVPFHGTWYYGAVLLASSPPCRCGTLNI